VVLPFSTIVPTPNDFVMTGGATTVTVAVLLVVPGPLSFEEMLPVVFGWAPALIPVTLTTIAHEPTDASDPPVRLRLPVPAVAVTVPPQLPLSPLGVEICKPAGKVSLKAMPVSAMALVTGFMMVRVSVVVPLRGMVEAPNALLMTGGWPTPVPVRARVCGLLPASSVIVRVPVRAPSTLGVKVMVIVQVALFATGVPATHVPPPVTVKSPASAPEIAMLAMLSAPPSLLVRTTV